MFCTSCGATITSNQEFCTSCGKSLKAEAESATAIVTGVSMAAKLESPLPPITKKRSRALIFSAAALLIGVLIGTGLTAAGAAEFAIGVRFTQEELDDAKTKAEKRGYDRGDQAGFDRGDQAGFDRGYDSGYSYGQTIGYSSGKSDGCNSVFDEIGESLIAIIPGTTRYYGYYYPRSSVC